MPMSILKPRVLKSSSRLLYCSTCQCQSPCLPSTSHLLLSGAPRVLLLQQQVQAQLPTRALASHTCHHTPQHGVPANTRIDLLPHLPSTQTQWCGAPLPKHSGLHTCTPRIPPQSCHYHLLMPTSSTPLESLPVPPASRRRTRPHSPDNSPNWSFGHRTAPPVLLN